MQPTKATILYAEDDINLGFITIDNLQMAGYRVLHAADGESAWQLYLDGAPDICLLDVMMPKIDGFVLSKQIRAHNAEIPIIFLSARTAKEDKLEGLRTGADDYLTKPFSIEELLLKLSVFLKRSKINIVPSALADVNQLITIGDYQLDIRNQQLVHQDGTVADLTERECKLLQVLIKQPNQTLKREDILVGIWPKPDYFAGRSLDVFISRLRKLLAKDTNLAIENVHSVGFRFKM